MVGPLGQPSTCSAFSYTQSLFALRPKIRFLADLSSMGPQSQSQFVPVFKGTRKIVILVDYGQKQLWHPPATNMLLSNLKYSYFFTIHTIIDKTCVPIRLHKFVGGPKEPAKNTCSLWLHKIPFCLMAKLFDLYPIYHPFSLAP